MTVREMLSKMDSYEITEWMAFYEIEAKKTKGPPLAEQMQNNLKGYGKVVIK